MANQVTVRSGIVRADTSGFKKLAKDLKAQRDPLARDLRLGLRAAGDIVAADASLRAGSAAQTIPPSIKVRVSGVSVAVVAGGAGVPLGGLMELGNKGGSPVGDTFQHPVFGKWRASTPPQAMHPYLVPAARDNEPVFERAAISALEGVERRLAGGS